MLGRPTWSGSANIGGAPLMAKSAADLTVLHAGTGESLTSFIDSPSAGRCAAAWRPPWSTPPTTPKPALAPLAFIEFPHLGKRRPNNRYKHELRQPLHGLELEGVPAAVPTAHHELPLVVRIDQSDQIA